MTPAIASQARHDSAANAAWVLRQALVAPDDQLTMNSASHYLDGYPVDIHGFVRQCAWCRRVADADGNYRLTSATLIQGASHGCCEACAIRFVSRGVKPREAA